MLKLLRAEFFRVKKFKPFYILLAINLALALINFFDTVGTFRYNPEYNAFYLMRIGMGGGISLLGIYAAVLAGLFIGREYSSGAMRNKVLVGSSRPRIYLSKLIAVAFMCVCVYCVYHLFNFVFGSIFLDWGRLSFSDVLLHFAAGLLMVLSYSAVMTALSMLSRSTVTSLLVGIFCVLVFSFLVTWFEQEIAGSYHMDAVTGEIAFYCDWPEALRKVCAFFDRLIPSGQSVVLCSDAKLNYVQLYACSAGLTAAVSVGGIWLFGRTDLK